MVESGVTSCTHGHGHVRALRRSCIRIHVLEDNPPYDSITQGNLLATWVEERAVAASALRRRREREDKDTSYHQSASVDGGSISTFSSNEGDGVGRDEHQVL